MYYDGGDRMGAGAWVLMVLVGVVLVGLLVAFIVWVVRDQGRRSRYEAHIETRSTSVAGSASEILDRRLATGEISIEEYERVKDTLAARAPGPLATGPPS